MLSMNVEFCERLVATLAHSLWQGLLTGILLVVATILVRSRGPEIRHAIAVICLTILVLCLPVTFVLTAPQKSDDAGAFRSISSNGQAIADLPEAGHRNEIDAASASMGNGITQTGKRVESGRFRWRQWAPWLSVFYFSGVLMGLTRLGHGVWACRVLRRAADRVTDPEWLRRVEIVRTRLGLRVAPALFWCRTSLVPTVIGITRPVILLPIAYATELSVEQIEQILCHELMHIRRRDGLINLMMSLAEALLFFHPVVWMTARRIRLERELCCDAASASSKEERWRYAQLLVQLAERASRPSLAATQLALVPEPSQMRVRVESLLRRPGSRKSLVEFRSFAVLAILVAGVVSIASRSVPAAPDGKSPRARKSQKSSANFWQMQQETIENERREQEEQMELSKDWKLKFPPDVQENELAGVIVDDEGRPIAGALVDFFPAITGQETTTDDQGMFRYPFKNAGRNEAFEVRFSKEGYSPVYRRQQRLGVKDFRVVLNSNTYLEGLVIDKEGRPVPKARVIANHQYRWGTGFNRETSTMTDENGRYCLYLFPETYMIAAITDEHGVERVSEVEILKNQGQRLDLQLHSGVLFKARVLDVETHEPVPGVVLYHRTEGWMHGKSDAMGDLVIPHCLPGLEDLQVGFGEARRTHGYIEYDTKPFGAWSSPEAWKDWHRNRTTEVALMFNLTANMPPITLYVESGVSISGKVIDPDGNPVARATVAEARTGTGNSLTGDTRYSVETKEDGTYQIYLPPTDESEYNLVAHDGSYGKWRKFAAGITEPMRTQPGQRIKNLDIKLQRAGTVRGRVTAVEGKKVGGLEVRAHAYDKRGNRYYDPTTRTRDDGTFEIGFIRPGKHYIQVEPMWLIAQEGPAESFEIVELKEGEALDGIELEYVGDE